MDVLEREFQATRVDLAIGEAQGGGGVLVLGLGMVADQDVTSIVVRHFPSGVVPLGLDLRFELLEGFGLSLDLCFESLEEGLLLEHQGGEFGGGQFLDGRLVRHGILRVVVVQWDRMPKNMNHCSSVRISVVICIFNFQFGWYVVIILSDCRIQLTLQCKEL